MRPRQVGVVEIGATQVGVVEADMPQDCGSQVRLVEVGADQHRRRQPDSGQVRKLQVGAGQVCGGQIRVVQIRAGKTGLAEVCSLQGDPAQLELLVAGHAKSAAQHAYGGLDVGGPDPKRRALACLPGKLALGGQAIGTTTAVVGCGRGSGNWTGACWRT